MQVRTVDGQPAGQGLDHLVPFGAAQVGGNDHHDAVTFPVGTGRLLPALADPDLDMGVEQRGGLGGVGHQPQRRVLL